MLARVDDVNEVDLLPPCFWEGQVFFNATHVGGNDALQASLIDGRLPSFLEVLLREPTPTDGSAPSTSEEYEGT